MKNLFKKEALIILILAVAIMSLTGCNKGIKKSDAINLECGECGITIKKDSIIYQVKESFDKDYYSQSELTDMVKKEIKEFNDNYGSDKNAAHLNSLTVKDKACEMIIEFDSMINFVEYIKNFEKPSNEFNFYYGSYGGLDKDSFAEDKNRVFAANAIYEDDLETMSNEQAESFNDNDVEVNDDTKVLAVNMRMKILSSDDILAVSEGVGVDGKTAHTTSDMCFIFYK